MMLSRESQYGLEGLVVLARQPRGRVIQLRAIADVGRLPRGFLSRIFQKLRRYNVVTSHRGVVRGYALARPAGDICLREIFEAIEGPNLFDRCIFSRPCDTENACHLHAGWAAMRAGLWHMMEETTLEQMASAARAGRVQGTADGLPAAPVRRGARGRSEARPRPPAAS